MNLEKGRNDEGVEIVEDKEEVHVQRRRIDYLASTQIRGRKSTNGKPREKICWNRTCPSTIVEN